MTRVAFEPDTGRLRLDPEAFAALTAEVETIWPTTPTTVWRYLTRLLPDDDELG